MSRTLTKKQRGFVKDYLDTGNGTEAARKNYNVSNDLTARVIASENLTKPNIRQYLEDRAERASQRVVELSEQEDHLPTALGASKDILDRAGYGAVTRTESRNLNVEVKLDNTKAEELRQKYEQELREQLT